MIPLKLQKLIQKQQPFNENILAEIHHVLMIKYGWIPLEEFLELPIPTTFSLLEQIRNQAETERKMVKRKKRR